MSDEKTAGLVVFTILLFVVALAIGISGAMAAWHRHRKEAARKALAATWGTGTDNPDQRRAHIAGYAPGPDRLQQAIDDYAECAAIWNASKEVGK